MKTKELIEFIKKQLKNADSKKIKSSKLVGGRLFDEFGENLTDFPEEIVAHVKKFSIKDLELWTEKLYKLVSQWIQEALQADEDFKEALNNYLTINPIKDFITGLYLSLGKHIITDYTTESNRLSGEILVKFINQTNITFYQDPLKPDDINHLYQVLTDHLNNSAKRQIFYQIATETVQKYMEVLAPQIVDKSLTVEQSVQELEKNQKLLSERHFFLLLNSLCDELMASNLDRYFLEEDGWDKLTHIVNLLAKYERLDAESFQPIVLWLSKDHGRMIKLSNKVMSHPYFLKFYPDYQKSVDPISMHIKGLISYIDTMKSLSDTVKSAIQQTADIKTIDGAVLAFTTAAKANEDRYGRVAVIEKQLMDISMIADDQKKSPHVVYAYKEFASADEFVNAVMDDIDLADSISKIKDITVAANNKLRDIFSTNPGKISVYIAKISAHEFVATFKKKFLTITEKTALLNLRIDTIQQLKSLQTVGLEKNLAEKYENEIDLLITPLKELLLKTIAEPEKFMPGMVNRIYVIEKFVIASEIKNGVEGRVLGADNFNPPVIEKFKNEILTLKLNDAQLLQLKKLFLNYSTDATGEMGYYTNMAIGLWITALTEILAENQLTSGAIPDFKAALQSAKTTDAVRELADSAKAKLCAACGESIPASYSTSEEDDKEEIIGKTAEDEEKSIFKNILKMIDETSKNKIELIIENEFMPVIVEVQKTLQSVRTIEEVHVVATHIKNFVKDEISSKLRPTDNPRDVGLHFKKLFEKFDEAARNKIDELTQELKPVDKATARQILNSHLRKNPNLYKTFKYIAYSAGGLLAAKVLLPHHTLMAVSQIGVEGVRAIINNPSVQAGIGIVSGAIATGIGLFKKTSQPTSDDKQSNETVFRTVVEIIERCKKECSGDYDTFLSMHDDYPASYLLKVVEIIATDTKDNQLGKKLAEAKTGLGIENISTPKLLAQLKELAETRMGVDIAKLQEKIDDLVRQPGVLIGEINSHLDRKDPALQFFYSRLAAVKDSPQQLQLSLIKEVLASQSPAKLAIINALNSVYKTNVAAEVWGKALDQYFAKQPTQGPTKAASLGR